MSSALAAAEASSIVCPSAAVARSARRGSVGEFGDDEGPLRPDMRPGAEGDDLDSDVRPCVHASEVRLLADPFSKDLVQPVHVGWADDDQR